MTPPLVGDAQVRLRGIFRGIVSNPIRVTAHAIVLEVTQHRHALDIIQYWLYVVVRIAVPMKGIRFQAPGLAVGLPHMPEGNYVAPVALPELAPPLPAEVPPPEVVLPLVQRLDHDSVLEGPRRAQRVQVAPALGVRVHCVEPDLHGPLLDLLVLPLRAKRSELLQNLLVLRVGPLVLPRVREHVSTKRLREKAAAVDKLHLLGPVELLRRQARDVKHLHFRLVEPGFHAEGVELPGVGTVVLHKGR
mmetsp:Transcript_99331/g.259001  ORF Transcript_99331/g.259001 Transcript_99331/m.259001 type:complete len:247 (+) Transcript_99331:1016-1756(+)